MSTHTIYDIASTYLESGLSFFPTWEKQPAYDMLPRRYDPTEKRKKATWIGYQDRRPTRDEVVFWYKERQAIELALVCGSASNANRMGSGLFFIDVDRLSIVPSLRYACGSSWDRVTRQRTRSGGLHLAMECDLADDLRNFKIAMRLNPDFISRERTPNQTRYLCDIETRGRGGYACAWPTPRYELEHLDFTHLPYLQMDEVYHILQAAAGLNQVEGISPSFNAVARKTKNTNSLSMPRLIIDEWRKRYSVTDMLVAYGYTPVNPRRFRRPGGSSGSLIVNQNNELAIPFSSNDPLRQVGNAVGREWHDSFGIYCVWEHDGDVRSALKSAAHELGITYHRVDYSETREDHQDQEIMFFDRKSDFLFVVDDAYSAMTLAHEGVAVLFVPSEVTNLGGWATKCLSFPNRYVWASSPDLLALAISAKVISCTQTANDLMANGDSVQFDQAVAKLARQARDPILQRTTRGIHG